MILTRCSVLYVTRHLIAFVTPDVPYAAVIYNVTINSSYSSMCFSNKFINSTNPYELLIKNYTLNKNYKQEIGK
jgi:hypothetical protein